MQTAAFRMIACPIRQRAAESCASALTAAEKYALSRYFHPDMYDGLDEVLSDLHAMEHGGSALGKDVQEYLLQIYGGNGGILEYMRREKWGRK